jgi:hypothetical protein
VIARRLARAAASLLPPRRVDVRSRLALDAVVGAHRDLDRAVTAYLDGGDRAQLIMAQVDATMRVHAATAVRADGQPRITPGDRRVPRGTFRCGPPLGERVAAALMCPACLLPRVVPGHRLRGCR